MYLRLRKSTFLIDSSALKRAQSRATSLFDFDRLTEVLSFWICTNQNENSLLDMTLKNNR